MSQPETPQINSQLNTYTSYSIGSAAVWTLILAAGHRRLDSETWKTLRLVCSGWWTGWTSATIARASYPPPKKLSPRAQERLGITSLALIALGFFGVIRLLTTGKRPAKK
jgi:hypothetical protein